MWLARVGSERIDETIDRALETYLKKGYSREWINQRLQAIQVRKELTDEWDNRGVIQGIEYEILTDEITKSWAGLDTREYTHFKGFKKENLRDNMSTLELVLNMLEEATTTELSKNIKPKDFDENREVAIKGCSIAGNARKEIESTTGKTVLTEKNSVDFTKVITDILYDDKEKDK